MLRHPIIALTILLAFTASWSQAAADKPNILVIVSDDHGYADTGFQGCKDVPTPHLDALAAGGVRCTSGYVSHPFCSPTRAGLLTGRYQHRFGHVNNPFYNPADSKEGLPLSETLLPQHLSNAGYATGWVGKWHLGAAPEFSPHRRGLSETFGFIGGGHRFRDWMVNPKVEYTVPVERNGKPVEVTGHMTAVLGKEAADFVTRHVKEPWFLYLAFNAPHTPHEPTDERLARFASIENPVRRKYAAQLSLMDDAIGQTLDALRASGQEQNTLVFFFSDNGGPIAVNGSINAPLRDAKGSVYEGGVRVPFLVRWPAKLKPGRYDRPVSSLDVFATTLSAAGAAMPTDRKYDSVDLLPYLTGQKTESPHEMLFWWRGKTSAVRSGDWKLVKLDGGNKALYDLKSDIGEKSDVSAANPEVLARLSAALDAWEKEMPEPAFPGAGGRAKPRAKPAK